MQGSPVPQLLKCSLAALVLGTVVGCASSSRRAEPAIPQGTVRVNSSYIHTAKYEDGALDLQFADGARQIHREVPGGIVAAFFANPGPYGYFKTHIRGKYPMEVLEKSYANRPGGSHIVELRSGERRPVPIGASVILE